MSIRINLKNNKHIAVLLFLASFILCFAFLNEGLFHFDSIITAQAIENSYKDISLHDTNNGRYGLVILGSVFYFPFYLAGQNADFSLRFMVMFFYALSIPMLYLFVQKFANDRKTAVFASLFMMASPVYLSPNTFGKEHGPAMFFLLLSFYLLISAKEKKSLLYSAASALSLVFCISIREAFLLGIPIYFLLLALKSKEEKYDKKFIILSSLLFFIAFGLLLKLYLWDIVWLMRTADPASKVIGLFSYVFKKALFDLTRTTAYAMWVFFALGIIFMFRKDKRKCVFLLLWFLLIFYIGNLLGFRARYLDFVLVPFFIFSGFAISSIYNRNGIWKKIAIGLALMFVIAMLVQAYPVLKFRSGYNGLKQYSLFIKENTPENALIISCDEQNFIQYYGNRSTTAIPNSKKELAGFIKEIDKRIKQGQPVYVYETAFILFKTGIYEVSYEELVKEMDTNFFFEPVGKYLKESYNNAEIDFKKSEAMLMKLHSREN